LAFIEVARKRERPVANAATRRQKATPEGTSPSLTERVFSSQAYKHPIMVFGIEYVKDALNFGYDEAKTKTSLRLCVGRIKLLKNKKSVARDALVRDVVELMSNNKHAQARVRVEGVLRDERALKSFEVLEILCEQLIVRLPLVRESKELPDELREPIASVMYAAKRSLDLPELAQAKQQFGRKYGKDFANSCDDEKTAKACGVNATILDCLKVRAVDDSECVARLEIIATLNGLEYEMESAKSKVKKEVVASAMLTDETQTVYKDAMEAAAAAESAAKRAQAASEAAAVLAGISRGRPSSAAETSATCDDDIDSDEINAAVEEILASPEVPEETSFANDPARGPPPGIGGTPLQRQMSSSAPPFVPKSKVEPPAAATSASSKSDDLDDLSKRFEALKR